MRQILLDINNSIIHNEARNAFFINNKYCSYIEFGHSITKIRAAIQREIGANEKQVGLVSNNDLETYAAIIALWMEGKAYIPLSPEMPEERNRIIIDQASIKTIIDSSDFPFITFEHIIQSKYLQSEKIDLMPVDSDDNELAYILFTSGTTGQPKGVPITRKNLQSFVSSFWNIGFELNEQDRCLQMFELTFDLSVVSYLIPIIRGACIYTIPKDKIKYAYIEELMETHKLTFSLMVPSILQYLRPYFSEIVCPEMKYSLFCGEALNEDITEEWSRCIPNAKIFNVYGPTEDTIFCTSYCFSRYGKNKSKNGILSIGKAMDGNKTIIINEQNDLIMDGSEGELCLGGSQLTPGYLNNISKNLDSFFYLKNESGVERFYRTGDLCVMDDEGDILYLGRMDSQIKIQGFRVELSEIEFHVKSFLNKSNAIALTIPDALGNLEICLVIEDDAFDIQVLSSYLRLKVPEYMVPKKIKFLKRFPLNLNGKIDKKELIQLFRTQ